MEDPRRRSAGSTAAGRRLRGLLALAGDYLKYLFMKRRRLMHRVARRTLALVHRHHGGGRRKSSQCPWPARALMEREFSCADSPSPAFLAAKRLLLRSRLRGGGAAAAAAGAVSSCFGSFRTPCGSTDTAAAPSELTETAVEEDHQLELEDEEEEDDEVMVAGDVWVQCGGELFDVDDRAEEFINMFYEQLRAQSFAAAVFQRSP
ncbi:hypothetical protein SEVIR_1G178300v4 [Setaria viridis]|uniref:Uncharacterized protein n=1 Tax=Setaria viridis TaxID=4556 RepID=A0A4U6WED5_SETVI|nr:uncharacterized protein LOC117865425 [Setaria viridis]TKW39429.1 hypothetical protein SEVIR_1G178300v2 [Setaria viridis]